MMEERKVPALRFQGFTDEWEKSEFKDVFLTLKNNTLSRAELHDTGTVQDLHYGDILTKFGEYLDMSEIKLPFITNSLNLQDFKSSFLQNGDIVMADTAEDETVGKCSELANINEKILLSGLHTIPLRPLLKFASGYLGDYLNSPAYHDQLLPLMQGTKVTSISKGNLMITKVKFPSRITEQDKIAKYFLMINKIINLCSEKCNQLMAFKKSMLEKMFPRPGEKVPEVRFRGFTGDWEKRKLGSIFEEYSEKNHAELPPLMIVQGGGTILRDESDRSLQYDRSNLSSYKMVNKDDFIVHLRSFEGGLEKASSQGIISPAYHTFHGEGIDARFYYAYFRSAVFIRHDLKPHVYGIRDGRSIDIEGMKSILIPYTSYEEQKKIGDCISLLDQLIMLCQRKLEKLQSLKQAMLSEMFI